MLRKLIARLRSSRLSGCRLSGLWLLRYDARNTRGCGFAQSEDRPALPAFAPARVGLDQACARAYVGNPAPRLCSISFWIETLTVIFEQDRQLAFGIYKKLKGDASGCGMAADVAHGLLHDAIDLNLDGRREREPLFKRCIAGELVKRRRRPRKRRARDVELKRERRACNQIVCECPDLDSMAARSQVVHQ